MQNPTKLKFHPGTVLFIVLIAIFLSGCSDGPTASREEQIQELRERCWSYDMELWHWSVTYIRRGQRDHNPKCEVDVGDDLVTYRLDRLDYMRANNIEWRHPLDHPIVSD